MWLLIIPVIIYSSALLVLWFILARRSEGASPGNEGLAEDCTAADTPVDEALPRISVVVAARNEEKHLPALLESLSCQDYPAELLEVIIVNDNSTDRTPIVVSEFVSCRRDQSGPRIRLIYNLFSGKKKAIRHGIDKAAGMVILTTDADCITGPGWVRSHAEWYMFRRSGRHVEDEDSRAEVSSSVEKQQKVTGSSGDPDMVMASVFQVPMSGFWSLFGVYEFSALQALSEATALAGRPVMCNAANMSFRRDVYLRYAGELRPDLPSGDDMFLLEAVMRGGGAARHDGRRAAAVETAGAVTAAALLRQRARWASKALYLRSAPTLILAAATAACNAAVTAAVVVACISV
ncbi:MAG: glycosyltransferase, partial [Bacteroidales bacterium]|nr:glycosyltransferase [Bacteroidales bacterium]